MKSSIKLIIISIFFYICEKLGYIFGNLHGIIINNYDEYKDLGSEGILKFKENYKNYKNIHTI